MNPVLLALGSNIFPRLSYLQQTVKQLGSLGSITAIAPLYKSLPYGETGQPAFLNTALQLETPLEPQELLEACRVIEKQVGRLKRYRWGPRETDIDIIFFARRVVNTASLIIPHADYQNRRFVLLPLADIAADWMVPDSSETIISMLHQCPGQGEVERYASNWFGNR